MSNWATLSENSGVGETTISVSVPATTIDRRCQYRVATPFQYVDVTVVQGNASPYFTVWYDVPYPYETMILTYNHGKNIKKMRVDDGPWIDSEYNEDEETYYAEQFYTFHSTGIHKIDYVSQDESSVPEQAFDAFGVNPFRTYVIAVNIPGEYKIIYDGAFAFNYLTRVTLNEGIEEIRGGAFEGCVTLKSLIMPNSVRRIGTMGPGICEGAISLEEIKYSDSLTFTDLNSCKGCISLKKVILSKNCETIYDESFYGCISLREIVFPSTVKSFYINALGGCVNLETFYCYAETCPQLTIIDGIESLKDLRPYGTFHYPQGSDYSTLINHLPETWTAIDDL